MVFRTRSFAIGFLAVLGLATGASVAGDARAAVIVVDDSIQEAVDAANPGDVIFVPPGTYTGTPGDSAVVTINKSDITLIGSPAAVIDATGFPFGIRVGGGALSPAGCPPIAVTNYRQIGLTIQNADFTGVLLVAVDGIVMTGGRYLDNEEYGPFPICSRNGVISFNFASGHEDAAIYVGDDDGFVVHHNTVVQSAIGIEVENSENTVVRDNLLTNNTAGVLVVVLPGLPKPFTRNVRIENNAIVDNNFPNPVAPGDDAVGSVPTGTGILNVGGDDVVIRNNWITGNNSFGVASVGNPFSFFDPRIEPFVDGLEVRDNVILNNGSSPDPLRALTPGADIVFVPDVIDLSTGEVVLVDPDPTDNCFAGNLFQTEFPDGITSLFPCP